MRFRIGDTIYRFNSIEPFRVICIGETEYCVSCFNGLVVWIKFFDVDEGASL